jgi:hypothetical protein
MAGMAPGDMLTRAITRHQLHRRGFAGTGVVAYGPNKLGSTTPGTKLIGDSATGPKGGPHPGRRRRRDTVRPGRAAHGHGQHVPDPDHHRDA